MVVKGSGFMNKDDKDFIESLNNDNLEHTSSFKDIMSRSELKKYQKNKDKNSKDNFDLNEDEKLEITNSFNKIIGKEPTPSKIENNIKPVKKNPNGPFLFFIVIIIFLGSLGFLVYSLFFNQDDPKQLYQIINSASIAFLAIMFGLTIKVSKKRLKRILQVITSLLLLVYMVITLLISMEILKLPVKALVENFANKNITSAMKWAKNNDITLNVEYDFSESIDKNIVISQDVEPNTLVSEIDELSVVVSDGPNYDMKVDVPDMVGWNIDEIIEEIEKLNLNNVIIEYEFNNDVERDIAFEQSRNGEMTRNDEITFKFSLGNENDLKPVKLKDLKEMTEFYATLWLKRNGIKYEIKYEYSDNIEYGKVISTDPVKGTTIDQSKDKVTLVISKGKKITAPDLTKMTLDEIISWANKNKLKITYDSEYDDSIVVGKVKRTNIKKGDIIDQSQTVHVILSKGKLKMISYDKDSIDKIRKFASDNNIPLEVTEEYSDSIEKGKIISVSHKASQIIKNSDTIKVVVSKGKSTKIPNFIGMSTSDAKNKCSNSNLVCSYEYAYSNQTEGTVIYQNKTSGQEVMEGSSIVLTISKGSAPSGETTYTPPSSNNNNNSSSSNTPTTPAKPTCYETVLYIYPSDLKIGDPTTTCSNIKSRYSGYSISCSYIDSDSGTSGQVLNSQELKGKTINSCVTETIVIKK